MVEISDINGTRNFGSFSSFTASLNTLDGLVQSGELPKNNPTVLVSKYNGCELRREYTASLVDGIWHILRAKKAPNPSRRNPLANSPEDTRFTLQPDKEARSVHSKTTRNSHIRLFKEAFPDWRNKMYQPL